MKYIKDIKNKLKWEKYYDPDFDWFDWTVNTFYMGMDNDVSEDFEDFIREFKDSVRWSYISESQKLSEDFIREFKNRVNWYFISHYQKLSENFIREFKDKVWWEGIVKSQILSEDFKEEFKKELSIS